MKYNTVRSAKSWRDFQDRVAQQGGTVLEPAWLGKDVPHLVRCGKGHEVTPTPGSVRCGRGICRACAGLDPDLAWREFKAAVAKLGGEVLEPEYLGAKAYHAVRCGNGHTTTTRPTGVREGVGICRYCKGKHWDVFYVVTDETAELVKFGVTSGNPRRRLGQHARDGFDHVELLVEDVPGTAAHDTENAAKSLLAERGAVAARGTEYFHLRWLPTVMAAASPLKNGR